MINLETLFKFDFSEKIIFIFFIQLILNHRKDPNHDFLKLMTSG